MPSCQAPITLTIATSLFTIKPNIARTVNLVNTNASINLYCLSLLIL